MSQVQPGMSEYEGEELDDKNGDGRRGHAKTSSYSERDRKIGHRRINEETGEVSYKKITTNQLMSSIQLGIHTSAGGLAKYPERDILMHDFKTVETTHFPKQGSQQTPAHPYADFTFRTYAPVAFRYFRDLFEVKLQDFMMSICNEPMRELSNPGASGSIFYLTKDDEFILKTVSAKEAEFLQKLLPGYYMNLQQNPKTTLPKFFGMFCYQCNQKNIRLVVMNNLLPSSIRMHLKFDLKGSSYKRQASKHEKEKKSPTFKDLDFLELLPEGLLLEPDTYTALVSTMRRDCRVLESFKIMDYSLLVGIHNIDHAAKEKESEKENGVSLNGATEADDSEPKLELRRNRIMAHATAMESIQATSDPVDIPGETPPGGIPARNHKGERLLLFVGVIDILQSYKLFKKLEHTFKSMITDGDTVSVHRPGFYQERFINFMADRVFKKIPSLDLPEVKGSHRKFRTVVASLIALKHSPSKRTKSVKAKVSGNGPGQSGTSQDRSGPPPNKEGMVGVPPDVVPDPTGSHHVWSKGPGSSSEVLSISDIRLEPRNRSTNSLGTPHHGSRSRRSPTPTWTEGTPSFTESTYSGDPAFPVTPSHSRDLDTEPDGYHETEMVSVNVDVNFDVCPHTSSSPAPTSIQ